MPDDFVAVAHEFSPLKANVIRSRLEAEGIRCFLSGETLASVVGSPSSMGNEISITVQNFDAVRARRILREIKAAPREDEGERKIKAKHDVQIGRVAMIGGTVLYITLQVAIATSNWTTALLAGVATLITLCVLVFKNSFKWKR